MPPAFELGSQPDTVHERLSWVPNSGRRRSFGVMNLLWYTRIGFEAEWGLWSLSIISTAAAQLVGDDLKRLVSVPFSCVHGRTWV